MKNINKKIFFIAVTLIMLVAVSGGYWYFKLRKDYLSPEEVLQKKERIKEFKKVDPNISSLPPPGESGEVMDQSAMKQPIDENVRIIRAYKPLPTPK